MVTASKKRKDADTVPQNAKEEMLLLLFREMSAHQQREFIIELQAMSEANRYSTTKLKGKPLRTASNEAVKAAYKTIPPPAAATRHHKRTKKKPRRDLGDAMGDFIDE